MGVSRYGPYAWAAWRARLHAVRQRQFDVGAVGFLSSAHRRDDLVDSQPPGQASRIIELRGASTGAENRWLGDSRMGVVALDETIESSVVDHRAIKTRYAGLRRQETGNRLRRRAQIGSRRADGRPPLVDRTAH